MFMDGILLEKGLSSTIWFLFIKAKELYCNLVMMCHILKTKMIGNILACFLFFVKLSMNMDLI